MRQHLNRFGLPSPPSVAPAGATAVGCTRLCELRHRAGQWCGPAQESQLRRAAHSFGHPLQGPGQVTANHQSCELTRLIPAGLHLAVCRSFPPRFSLSSVLANAAGRSGATAGLLPAPGSYRARGDIQNCLLKKTILWAPCLPSWKSWFRSRKSRTPGLFSYWNATGLRVGLVLNFDLRVLKNKRERIFYVDCF